MQRSSPKGVLVSLLASVLFASIFYLTAQLSSSAEVVWAWRVFKQPGRG